MSRPAVTTRGPVIDDLTQMGVSGLRRHNGSTSPSSSSSCGRWRRRLSRLHNIFLGLCCPFVVFSALSITGWFPPSYPGILSSVGDASRRMSAVEDLTSLSIRSSLALVNRKPNTTNRPSNGVSRGRIVPSKGEVNATKNGNWMDVGVDTAATRMGHDGTTMNRTAITPFSDGPIQMKVQYYELWNHTTNTIEIPDEHRYFGKNKPTSLEILQRILQEKRDRVNINRTKPDGTRSLPECLVADTANTRALADNVVNGRETLPKGPILYVGMPKTGTTSLFSFFKCSGFAASHHQQGAYMMGTSLKQNLPPLQSNPWNLYYERLQRRKEKRLQERKILPTNGSVFKDKVGDDNVRAVRKQAHLQLDTNTGTGYFPQIQLLDELHQEEPNSIFILAFRPIKDWIRSARKHHHMAKRWGEFEMPGLIITDKQRVRRAKENATRSERAVRLSDGQLRNWFCGHVHHIREYVREYPSHRLIELDLYDNEGTASVLADLFQSNTTCWGHENKNELISGPATKEI